MRRLIRDFPDRTSLILAFVVRWLSNIFANNSDPDETVHHELSHQGQHCLPRYFRLLSGTPVCNSGNANIQIGKSPLQKRGDERVNKTFIKALTPVDHFEVREKKKMKEREEIVDDRQS